MYPGRQNLKYATDTLTHHVLNDRATFAATRWRFYTLASEIALCNRIRLAKSQVCSRLGTSSHCFSTSEAIVHVGVIVLSRLLRQELEK